jgi:hypothetical protein
MSPTAIFVIGVFTTALCILYVYVSFHEIKTTPPGVTVVHGLLPVAGSMSPLDTPAPRPLKIMLAVDGSPCSDRAVQSVAMRRGRPVAKSRWCPCLTRGCLGHPTFPC